MSKQKVFHPVIDFQSQRLDCVELSIKCKVGNHSPANGCVFPQSFLHALHLVIINSPLDSFEVQLNACAKAFGGELEKARIASGKLQS
jgi:hypothetical protein